LENTAHVDTYLGHEAKIDLYGCPRELLETVPGIEMSMIQAAQAGNAHIVSSTFKQFDPWGVSGVLVISESHIAIHTWPEYGYAAIDIFTCGTEMEVEKVYRSLVETLKPTRYNLLTSSRGLLDEIRKSPE
jgi:S-adenosylmethionine decarboxylase proenzyme